MTRFAIAQDGPKPTEAQLKAQQAVREGFKELEALLDAYVAPGREQSLALTKLEEALMWAGKGIFA